MDELTRRTADLSHAARLTLRDMVMPIFRQRRLASLIFLGVFVGALTAGLLTPPKYEAEMKILLNRDRVDTVVTPDPNAAEVVAPVPLVSEQDINSEVELLRSRDLLESTVTASGLADQDPSPWKKSIERLRDIATGARYTPQTRIARTVQDLNDRLIVEPLKKTTVIRVAYSSGDPVLSARVLQTLSTLYQEKHAAVHRPPGAFGFFDQQAARYREELAAAETKLMNFDAAEDIVAPAVQKQLVLGQLSQFETEMAEDRATADSDIAKSKELHAEATAAPDRQTTQVRKAANAELLAQLEGTLLSLELKRSEMLMKYAPAYLPVRQVETQIEETRSAIQKARLAPVEDITTDRAPVQDWMATEIAKAQSERAQMEARAASAARLVSHYREVAKQLDHNGTMQDDLVRNVKSAEDNYLLYVRKREEARISDALDRQHIVNVSIAEAPTVPALSTLRLGWLFFGSLFAASGLSIGAAYAVDRLDPSFRTADELHRYLDVSVLASIPAKDATGDVRSTPVIASALAVLFLGVISGTHWKTDAGNRPPAKYSSTPATAMPVATEPTAAQENLPSPVSSHAEGRNRLAAAPGRAVVEVVVEKNVTLRHLCLVNLNRFDQRTLDEFAKLNPAITDPNRIEAGQSVLLPLYMRKHAAPQNPPRTDGVMLQTNSAGAQP